MGEVMIKFKKTFQKIEKRGSKLYIKFANYKVDDGFNSNTFLNEHNENSDYIYISAYPSVKVGDKYKSISGHEPHIDTGEYINGDISISNNETSLNYNAYNYIYSILMLLTKTTNLEKVFGSAKNNIINGTLNRVGLFHKSINDESNKVLGIENLWSNTYTHLDGLYMYNSEIYNIDSRKWDPDNSLAYKLNTDRIKLGSGYMKDVDVAGNFIYPISLDGSSNTYMAAQSNINGGDGLKYFSIGGKNITSNIYNISTESNNNFIRFVGYNK